MDQPCPRSHFVHMNTGSDSDKHFGVGDML